MAAHQFYAVALNIDDQYFCALELCREADYRCGQENGDRRGMVQKTKGGVIVGTCLHETVSSDVGGRDC